MPGLTLTDAGRQALTAAGGTNALTLTRAALGTGRYTPDGTETALTEQAAEASLTTDASAADGTITATARDEGDLAYSAYELGLFAKTADGTEVLLGIFSDPDAEPFLVKSATSIARVTLTLTVGSAQAGGVDSGSVSFTAQSAATAQAGLVALASSADITAASSNDRGIVPTGVERAIGSQDWASLLTSLGAWEQGREYSSGDTAFTLGSGGTEAFYHASLADANTASTEDTESWQRLYIGSAVESQERLASLTANLSSANRSAWVITRAVDELDLGTPGTVGFGVGYVGSALDLLMNTYNVFPMPGHDDPADPWYGNYLHPQGGHFVCIPKFYLRYGYEGSPQYAAYGVNSIDIISRYGYEKLTAEEQATGWFLPRCFIDLGAEQDFFLVSKYQVRYHFTNGYCMSSNKYYPTKVGSTSESDNRIRRYNFIAYSKALDGMAAMSAFMHAALGLVNLANMRGGRGPHNACTHATETTSYSKPYHWMVANGPARANITDGMYLRNAHNGQACGVMDNGHVGTMVTGLTVAASSNTTGSFTTSPSLFLMSRSASITDFTGAYGAATDHWNSSSTLTSSSTVFDNTAYDWPYAATLDKNSNVRYWIINDPDTQAFSNPETDNGHALFGVLPRNSGAVTSASTTDGGRLYTSVAANVSFFFRQGLSQHNPYFDFCTTYGRYSTTSVDCGWRTGIYPN